MIIWVASVTSPCNMSRASLLLLALACGVAVAEDYDRRAATNDNSPEASFKSFSSFHNILEGLTDANKEAPKPLADEESRVADKLQATSGVSAPHNSRKKITVGDLLHAIIQKTKTRRDDKQTGVEKDEGRRTNGPEINLGISNEDSKFIGSKDNVFGLTKNSEKANNSVMIINLGGVQGDELSFLNDLDHRKCLIYVVQPGGRPQLHPMNQLHSFLRSDVPKYVVLFGNGQAHLFGNSGLQYLNTLLANSVNIPSQPNDGPLPNNVPRTLIPLFNLLPNLGVHVINVLPNAWTNAINPKQPNVHNQGGPIINIFPNIGKPLSPDIPTTPPSSGIQGNFDIPDFLRPWINVFHNVTERPITNPIIATTTNAPDAGTNWLDMLQKIPGMNIPDKEASRSSGDINSLLTILGIEQRHDKSVKPGSEDTIVSKNQNSLALKPTSPNKDNVGLSNNDLLLALTKLFIENNKNNNAKEKPEVAPMPASPNIPDSSIINGLIHLISEKSSLVSKLDKKVVVDDGVSNKGLIEKLVQLLGRKSDVMVNSDNDVKEKKMQTKLSEVLIELLDGHPNMLFHGKGTNMVTDKNEVENPKLSETDLYDILVRILRDHPSVIKGSKGVSGKKVTDDEEGKLPNRLLQLLGMQSGLIATGVTKPEFNAGSQAVVPNWPVSVSNEGFQPGGVGIDPQYLALLMKTFSGVNSPSNYGQSSTGGNVKFNLPPGFGGGAPVQPSNGMWNYLLSHLGCLLDEGGGYGMSAGPPTNVITSNAGAAQGMIPLQNWLQLAQMPRNTLPNLYHANNPY